jgi:hypothetical protein
LKRSATVTVKVLAAGSRGQFSVVDRVGRVDSVVGVRSHTGEVLSVDPMDHDIEKLAKILFRKRG